MPNKLAFCNNDDNVEEHCYSGPGWTTPGREQLPLLLSEKDKYRKVSACYRTIRRLRAFGYLCVLIGSEEYSIVTYSLAENSLDNNSD